MDPDKDPMSSIMEDVLEILVDDKKKYKNVLIQKPSRTEPMRKKNRISWTTRSFS